MKTSKHGVFNDDPPDGGPYPPEHFAERPGTPPSPAHQFQETGKPAGRGVGPLDCGDVVQWLVGKGLLDGAVKVLEFEQADSATAEKKNSPADAG